MKVTKQTGTANTTYSPGRQIKYLAIHYTAGVSCKSGSAASCASWFANPNAGGSADYIVDEGGLVQYNPDPHNRYCWAVGGSKYNTQGGRLYGIAKNANCVSLEICSGNKVGKITYPNDPNYYFTTAVEAKAIEATKYLMELYGIDADHVIRHYDVNGKCCLPIDKTELLTPNGWVSLGRAKVGMKVAQYDPTNDSITFASVSDVVEPRVEEVLKNRYLEATADHRMWVKPNSKNSHDFREMIWGDILDGKKQYVIKTASNLETEGIELTDNEIRLLVWIQGDGHYIFEKRAKKGIGIQGIEFHLKKERKILRILNLLDDMNIPHSESYCKNGSVHIRTFDKSLYLWSETWLTNKAFNYNLMWMSQHQFDVFWEELMQVDGSVESQLYSSSIDHNNDVVQAICALHGKRSSKISMGNTNGGGKSTIMTASTNHCVGQGGSNIPIKRRTTIVSCVTVPTGFILVRNNDKTFIVGNCPGIIGWNKDSGSEDKWNAFHEAIGGTPIHWYRVRLAWDKPETQIGAYINLDTAKQNCPAGYSVFDDNGKVVYTNVDAVSSPQSADKYPSGIPASKEVYINAVGSICQQLYPETKILPSVVTAQCCLETGFGLGGDSVQLMQVNNLLGMKTDLINSTWKQWSVWKGGSIIKRTPEYHNGQLVYINDSFRKYTDYENCIRDYEMFLLHVRNNKGLKYARIAGMTDPAQVIHAIRIGTGTDARPEGYCTDPAYESKILSLIKQYNLTKYDTNVPTPQPEPQPQPKPEPQPQPTPTPSKKKYRVRVGIYKYKSYLDKLSKMIKDKTGLDCFSEQQSDGTHLYCGSFDSKANAEERAKLLAKAGFNSQIETVTI